MDGFVCSGCRFAVLFSKGLRAKKESSSIQTPIITWLYIHVRLKVVMQCPKEALCDELRIGYEGNACLVIVTPQITDYATSVVLHYYSATDPTAQVRGFLVS